MKHKKVTVGNSTIGYDSCECVETRSGKLRIVASTIVGRSTVIRRAVANLNRGQTDYVTHAGDCLPISVR